MGCSMSDEFVRVADTGQLPSGSMMLVEPDGSERILLVNLDGTYHAISELCPHYGVPLSQSRLYEDEVEWPPPRKLLSGTDRRGPKSAMLGGPVRISGPHRGQRYLCRATSPMMVNQAVGTGLVRPDLTPAARGSIITLLPTVYYWR